MQGGRSVFWKSSDWKGDLLKGVQMENGGILRVEANCVNVELPESLPEDKPDNRILKVCKGIREEEKAGRSGDKRSGP